MHAMVRGRGSRPPAAACNLGLLLALAVLFPGCAGSWGLFGAPPKTVRKNALQSPDPPGELDPALALARFRELDVDGSGTLTRGECIALLEELGVPVGDDGLELIMAELDLVGNGHITLTAFEQWAAENLGPGRSAMKAVLVHAVEVMQEMDILKVLLLPMVVTYMYTWVQWIQRKIYDILYTQIRFQDPASVAALREYLKLKRTDAYTNMEVTAQTEERAGDTAILLESNVLSDSDSTMYDIHTLDAAPMSISHLPVIGESEYFVDPTVSKFRLPFLWLTKSFESAPLWNSLPPQLRELVTQATQIYNNMLKGEQQSSHERRLTNGQTVVASAFKWNEALLVKMIDEANQLVEKKRTKSCEIMQISGGTRWERKHTPPRNMASIVLEQPAVALLEDIRSEPTFCNPCRWIESNNVPNSSKPVASDCIRCGRAGNSMVHETGTRKKRSHINAFTCYMGRQAMASPAFCKRLRSSTR